MKQESVGRKEELTQRLEEILEADRDEDVLGEIIYTKLYIHWEIEKEELF